MNPSRPRRAPPGGVVRVVGIRQQDGLALVREHEREIDDPGLRPGDNHHLGAAIELDPVELAVPPSDRLPQLGQAPERRVSVSRIPPSRLGERLDHVRRRPRLGIPAPEIDERLPIGSRRHNDASEQGLEVLLRKPVTSPRGLGQ
jgi:hypothetical protein